MTCICRHFQVELIVYILMEKTMKKNIIFLLTACIITTHASLKSIAKINDHLYVGKKGDLYFALERVTSATISFWKDYAQCQLSQSKDIVEKITTMLEALKPLDNFKNYLFKLYKKQDKDAYILLAQKLNIPNVLYYQPEKPKNFELFEQQWEATVAKLFHIVSVYETIQSFLEILDYYQEIDHDIWVTYAATKKITAISTAMEFNKNKDIEMVCGVATTQKIPFSTHMGIFRTLEIPKDKQHKNLSIQLHAFAAQVIQSLYAKQLMITRPHPVMLAILEQQLAGACWIDNKKPFVFHDYKQNQNIVFKPFAHQISFTVPAFFTQRYLAEDYDTPMIVIKLNALAKLVTFDTEPYFTQTPKTLLLTK